jgi:hypothetical protein
VSKFNTAKRTGLDFRRGVSSHSCLPKNQSPLRLGLLSRQHPLNRRGVVNKYISLWRVVLPRRVHYSTDDRLFQSLPPAASRVDGRSL